MAIGTTLALLAVSELPNDADLYHHSPNRREQNNAIPKKSVFRQRRLHAYVHAKQYMMLCMHPACFLFSHCRLSLFFWLATPRP